MADIEVRVHGEGSEAKEALDHVATGAHGAHEATSGLQTAMHELGEELGHTLASAALFTAGLEKGVEFLKEFASESVKLYEAQETADRNLALMAGNLTAQLKEQAEEFEKVYGVAAETTERIQTLALAHGADRDSVAELTEATTKWAAITGTDAASAAEALTRAVETGRHSARSLGIQWEETGDKAQDLKNAIEALNEKLAGADPTAEGTLQGRANRAALAFENIKKSFGSWVANIERAGGVLDHLGELLDKVREHTSATGVGAVAGMAAYGPMGAVLGAQLGHAGADSDIADAPAHQNFDSQLGNDLPWSGGAISPANQKADASAALAAQKKANAAMEAEDKREFSARAKLKDEQNKEAIKQDDVYMQETLDGAKLGDDMMEEYEKTHQEKMLDLMMKGLETDSKIAFEKIKQAEDTQKAIEEINIRAFDKQEKMAEQANKKLLKLEEHAVVELVNTIGPMVTNALESALSGQKQQASWQDIAGAVAKVALTIVGEVIGGVASEGAPGGTAIGGALGSLAGSFGDWGIHQIKHDGGMVERYHRGGYPGTLGPNERPVIAEVGEAIIDKHTVARMGGPAGIEAAKRGGGGGMQVTIQTMDAASMRDTFEGRGSRAMVNAMRSGRGSLPRLIGGR